MVCLVKIAVEWGLNEADVKHDLIVSEDYGDTLKFWRRRGRWWLLD
jgi:hypothetical protein